MARDLKMAMLKKLRSHLLITASSFYLISCGCNPGVVVNNVANIEAIPGTISILSPSSGDAYTSGEAIIAVSGECSIDLNSLSTSHGVVDDGDCSDGTWSLDNVVLSSGENALTVSGVDIRGTTMSDILIVTYTPSAPNAATALSWVQSNPYNGTSLTAQWVKSTSLDLTNQTLQFYSDSNCGSAVGSVVNLNSTVLQSSSFSGSNGNTYSFKVTSINAAALSTQSSCSSSLAVDTSAPVMTITAPNSGTDFTTGTMNQTISGTCSTDAINLTSSLGTFSDSNCSDGTFALSSYSLSMGINTFTIQANDLATNTGSDSISITYNASAPSVAVTSPNSGVNFSTNTQSQTLSGTCSSDVGTNISTNLGSMNDGDCANGTWSMNAYNLSVGANAFTITATNGVQATANLTITYDVTAPEVQTVQVQAGRIVDVTFNEAMGTGVTTAANYTVSGTGVGTLAANPTSVSLQSGNTYRLTWAAGEMLNGGNITITVANAQDAAGNTVNGAANAATHTGGAVGSAPEVESVAVVSATTVDVTFSEAMGAGVTTAANYTLSGSGMGSLASTPNSVTSQGGNVYRLAWTAMSNEMFNGGNIVITVANAQDAAGNPIGSTNSAGHIGGGIGTRPSVTVNEASTQSDPVSVLPINYTVVFSEAIVPGTFASTDVTVTGTATGVTVGTPTTSDNITWNVPVTAATAAGATGNTIILSLAAGVVTDAAGNLNTVSTSTDNSVTYDTISPAIPTFTSIAPATGSNDNEPIVKGTVETGGRILMFRDSNCTARIHTSNVYTGYSDAAINFSSNGTRISVLDDTTISIYGMTLDASGNTSACTLLTTYEEDSGGGTLPTCDITVSANETFAAFQTRLNTAETNRASYISDGVVAICIANGVTISTANSGEGSGIEIPGDDFYIFAANGENATFVNSRADTSGQFVIDFSDRINSAIANLTFSQTGAVANSDALILYSSANCSVTFMRNVTVSANTRTALFGSYGTSGQCIIHEITNSSFHSTTGPSLRLYGLHINTISGTNFSTGASNGSTVFTILGRSGLTELSGGIHTLANSSGTGTMIAITAQTAGQDVPFISKISGASFKKDTTQASRFLSVTNVTGPNMHSYFNTPNVTNNTVCYVSGKSEWNTFISQDGVAYTAATNPFSFALRIFNAQTFPWGDASDSATNPGYNLQTQWGGVCP